MGYMGGVACKLNYYGCVEFGLVLGLFLFAHLVYIIFVLIRILVGLFGGSGIEFLRRVIWREIEF